MKLKYKENVVYKIAGCTWLIVALINLALALISLNSVTVGFGWGVNSLLILNIFLTISLAAFYFKITNIDYVRLKDNVISIHKGFVLPRQKINVVEIERGRVVGDTFILLLRNEKEVEINLKMLTVRDHDRLIEQLGVC